MLYFLYFWFVWPVRFGYADTEKKSQTEKSGLSSNEFQKSGSKS
jgi:hypothetical protein